MSNFNILRNAIIRNSTKCRRDTNVGFSVVWEDNEDFEQYTEFNGLTTRLVWDRNYFAVATSGICYVGPASDQVPFDGALFDTVKVFYRVETDFNQIIPTTGRIQFQTNDDPIYDSAKTVDFPINADNSYNEYTIDMSQIKLWQGEIIRIRLYPFIDGQPGNIVHLKSLRVEASNLFICATAATGSPCDSSGFFLSPCGAVGSGGSCQSIVVSDGFDIIEGVNDKLIVNINGYGDQGITLSPVTGGRLKDVARDIEEKLSNIGIGGYSGNRVDVEFSRLKITADDTRESSSTVVVQDTPAARTLGFFSIEGDDVSTRLSGTNAGSLYEPAGTIQLSRGQIAQLYLPDTAANQGSIDFEPRSYAVQAGRPDFDSEDNQQKISFLGDTIIDFNNPVTNTGVITFFTYSGDATLSTKLVFLRPKSDGRLTQFASVSLGASSSFLTNRVYEKTMSVKVHKGDLIGIYDARVDIGRVEQTPNVSYYLYDGAISDGQTIPLPDVVGRGDQGLRMFARGKDKQTSAVLDIEFEQPQLIEEISIFAEEEVRTEEVNLTQALAGGINGGPFITGETGKNKFGAQAPPLTGLGSLTDGIRRNVPGAPTMHPSWLDGTFSPADLYDQTEFSFDLDFAKGIPVLFYIDRFNIYFRDTNNVKFFRVDYPITTNAFDTDRNWGPVAGRYNAVYLDGEYLEPTDHPLYSNPITPTAREFTHSYQFLQYRQMDVRFDPVRARSLRYQVKNFAFVDDPTKSTLSNFTLAPSAHILEAEVYARSVPKASIADNFFFESAADENSEFVLHQTVRDDGATSARYLIGYPVQFVRAHIVPQGRLRVKSFSVSLSRSHSKIETNFDENFEALQLSQNDHDSFETVKITNTEEETYNFFIDISPQKNPVERCILWNKMGNLEELNTSELGPSPSYSRRADYKPREYNYAYLAPAYVNDPFWIFNVGAVAYISYDHGTTWSPQGTVVTDYSDETQLNAFNEQFQEFFLTFILIDLKSVYNLETFQQFTAAGGGAWSGPFYSDRDTDDPYSFDVGEDFTGVQQQARWLMFSAFSRALTDTVNPVARMAYIQASLSPLSLLNKNKMLWSDASNLTNYVFGNSQNGNICGDGAQCNESGVVNYYLVDLQKNYRITEVFKGPILGSISGDLDFVSTGNLIPNANVTYSSSNVSDPNKIAWKTLGQVPGDLSRWILIRSSGEIVDEVAVRIEDNNNDLKKTFDGRVEWWTSKLGTVRKDLLNYKEGLHSIAIDYSSNQGPEEEEIEIRQSFGIDHILAKRDSLHLWLHISDITQLDLTSGHIAIGRNTNESHSNLASEQPDRINYFQWNLSDLADILTSGWNELFLPFTDNFRVGQPFFTRDNYFNISFDDVSGKSRFQWFRINFRGIPGNDEFTINVDDMRIVRTDFVPVKFGNGFYITGTEYAKFPLNNFNTLQGTIEFYIRPDWSKTAHCNSCDNPQDHAIFRIFNSDDFMLALFMTGEGMRIHFTDGLKTYFITDNNSPLNIFVDEPTHLAVTWDFKAERSDKAVAFYVNGQVSSLFSIDTLETDGWLPNPNAVLMLGGVAWGGLVSRYADGVAGAIDNLKIYNYAKSDFSHSLNNEGLEYLVPSDQLIEISIDGINFFGSETRGDELPVLVRNVEPGESFNVYVRHKDLDIDVSKSGQTRTSFIEVMRARAG